jgi:hypothetical protein
MTSKYVPLSSLGYYICDIPESILNFLNNETEKIISTNFKNQKTFKSNLAGAIEHEYTFPIPANELNKFFEEVVPEYWKAQHNSQEAKRKYNFLRNSDGNPALWINFQKQYEYNPIHNHAGVLSFTCWIKIPYKLEDELELPSNKNSASFTGPAFFFHFPTIHPAPANITNYRINVDSSMEGKMIIFPAWLQHSVTPFFTSDDYRISISGNLVPVN